MPRLRAAQRPTFGKPRTVFRGKLHTIEQWNVRYPSGRVETWERVRRAPSVAVLAFDKRGRLLLIHEYRHALKRWRWGVPAGRVDKERSARAAAQRELREETGYRARKLRLFMKGAVGGSWVIPRYVYLAADLVRAPLPRDEGERIHVYPTALQKAASLALRGGIDAEFVALAIIRLWHARKKWLQSAR